MAVFDTVSHQIPAQIEGISRPSLIEHLRDIARVNSVLKNSHSEILHSKLSIKSRKKDL